MIDAVTTHTAVLADRIGLEGARVVDVGCGSGERVRWLRSQGADVVGIECGEVMMRLALDADPEHPEAYIDGVGQDLPLPDGDRDLVVMSFSLHHIPREAMVAALAEAHRVLRPGGLLYVAEPIAAGPMHEVVRIVDDETQVRAWAQEALEHVGAMGFEPVERSTYRTETLLDSPQAIIDRIVGIDPHRAATVDEHRAEFVTAFDRHATRRDDRFVFEQETRLAIFRKPDEA